MRISDWSSDVCSSDLRCPRRAYPRLRRLRLTVFSDLALLHAPSRSAVLVDASPCRRVLHGRGVRVPRKLAQRSEEHTSELQSLMRTSYAVFCLKTNNNTSLNNTPIICCKTTDTD